MSSQPILKTRVLHPGFVTQVDVQIHDALEAAAKVAPNNAWFQVYATADERINGDMVRRARDLALQTRVLTVDVPVNSNRERNRRNGFSRPPKMTLAVIFESLRHPAWVINFNRTGGIPTMENWAPYAPAGRPPKRSRTCTGP